MDANDQLQAILDNVLPDPLERTTTVDANGRSRVTYTENPYPGPPNIDGIVQAQHELNFYRPGTTYRKYSIVRKGLTDYLALEQTATDPEDGPWVVARQNIQGLPGSNGGDYDEATYEE